MTYWSKLLNFAADNFDSIKWEGADGLGDKVINDRLKAARRNVQRVSIRTYKGYNLEIKNIKPEDAGTYFCFTPMSGVGSWYFNKFITSYELIISGN